MDGRSATGGPRECQAMTTISLPRAARRTAGLAMRHKVVTGSIAVFTVALIAVSFLTSGTASTPSGTTEPLIGTVAPGFTLTALGKPGQQVSLSQYQGKPLIINFWASWCAPCQQETPLLASWYKQQHGHVALLGLDENDIEADALKFANAKGVR